MPNPNRTYTEKEIAALLERTAQLQADDARDESPTSNGLSLAELEGIAAEAGLDPEYLHRAALEIESKGKKGFQKRTKTHIRAQRFLSAELDDVLWEEFVFELRNSFEGSPSADLSGMGSYGKGIVEQIGRSREWRHTSLSGVHTSVLLRPYKDGTRIEMSQRVGLGSPTAEASVYGFMSAILPTLIAAGITKSFTVAAIAMALSLIAFIPLVYFLDVRWRDKKLTKLEAAADRLVDLAHQHEKASGVKQAEVNESERIARTSEPTAEKSVPQQTTGKAPLLTDDETNDSDDSAHDASRASAQNRTRA